MKKAFIVSVFMVVCAVALSSGAMDTVDILFPRGTPALVNVHSAHAERKIACTQCHPGARTSAWASERLVPDKVRCVACHAEAVATVSAQNGSDRCDRCHLSDGQGGIRQRGEYPRPQMRFSHRAHGNLTCVSCHGDMRDSRSKKMAMKACYTCHQARNPKLAVCRTCHLVYGDGRIVTAFGQTRLYPPEWLAGPSHGAEWNLTHGPSASSNPGLCTSCHTEKSCEDCHMGRLMPQRTHPSDWLNGHGVASRMDGESCVGCHRAQSFCIDCHRRAGVAPDSPTGTRAANPGNYHRGKAPADICRRARTDLAACVSCHSESSCIRCHGRINPHPPGYARRCRALASQNAASCGKCHDAGVINRCQ